MLEHGGALNAAARHYGRLAADWLDLSTGINPHGYPAPPLPAACWRRLPEEDDGLEEAARGYYGARQVLAVAGSQAAIQALPWLRPPGRTLVLGPMYAEHAAAWGAAGHAVTRLPAERAETELETAAADNDTVVLCQPNNPTGLRLPPERLRTLARTLAARGAWLVLDEAFMDGTPEDSLAGDSDMPGLVVLRSLGKFFGLAGLRVGFSLAEPGLLARLRDRLGPWTVAGPSRAIACAALRDQPWQEAMRSRLAADSQRLADLLKTTGLGEGAGTVLFRWLSHPDAAALHEKLARQGVLVRLFLEPSPSLRLGLPGSEAEWQRLETALRHLEK